MTLVHPSDLDVAPYDRPEHTAVDKAIRVLAAFPPGASAIGVTELAQKLGLPKSTVFRALKVLARHGLVETVGGKYQLGHRLFELGKQVYKPSLQLWEVLSPVALQLCAGTRQSVALGVLRNDGPVVVGLLSGTTYPAGGVFRLGATVPAHGTALGKALIAHSPAAAENAVRRGLDPMTPRTIVEPARLGAELESVRRGGLAYEHGECTSGCSAVAIALLDPAGHPAAAITVFGRSAQFDAERVGQALRQSRSAASALLRGRA